MPPAVLRRARETGVSLGKKVKKLYLDAAPLVMAFVLGPIMETTFRQALIKSSGSFSIFFTRPIAAVLLLLCVLSIAGAIAMRRRQSKAVQVLVEGAQDEK